MDNRGGMLSNGAGMIWPRGKGTAYEVA
ncbi:hypothetical protein [Acidocella sp.]